MKPGLQQGHADGLCGLYAIINFLAEVDGWKKEKAENALWYVLDITRQLGWLTPHHLTSGFEAYQLKVILNTLFEAHYTPFSASFIEEIEAGLSEQDAFQLAENVLSVGGRLLVGPEGHWVLVTRHGKKSVIVDSASVGKPIRSFDRRSSSLKFAGGVIILPKQRATVKIGD